MSSLLETPEYQAAARFVELTVEKRQLQNRMDEIVTQLKTMEPALIAFLSAAGQKEFIVRNYALQTHREPWIYPVTGVSREAVCEALKISGLKRMVKENYSTQSLTKYVKDLEEHHKLIAGLQPGALEQILPPALAQILNVKAAFSLRVQKKERGFDGFLNQEYEPKGDDHEQP